MLIQGTPSVDGDDPESRLSIQTHSSDKDNDLLLEETGGNAAHESQEQAHYKNIAALRLQKVYKSFRTRRQLADCAVLAEQKWWKVLDSAELKRSSISFFDIEKHESALSKWSRARTRAAIVGKGLSKAEKARKLALQHWLEAIDPRHRYGHNLQFYYVKWLHCKSNQPFFYWLDIGDGKEENIEERCPRTKLQQECIKYLGPIERGEYEVLVENGIFIYKRTGKVLDSREAPIGTKWIFVLSTLKTLYVGQKIKGTFQHSSFLAGGATLSAGRLVVENGYLKAVWPHSGHYLPTAENFEAFMSFLVEHKVDITRVQKVADEDEEEAGPRKKDAFIKVLRRIRNKTLFPGPSDNEIQGNQSSENQLKQGEEVLKADPNSTTGDKTSIINHQDDNAPEISDGYETAEESILSEEDFTYQKENLFGEDEEDEYHEAISPEIILQRINSHRLTSSYQLGKQLSCRWTTGAGPRIGCLRDYPWHLQFQALEQVNLSPKRSRRSSFSEPIMSSGFNMNLDFSREKSRLGLDLNSLPRNNED